MDSKAPGWDITLLFGTWERPRFPRFFRLNEHVYAHYGMSVRSAHEHYRNSGGAPVGVGTFPNLFEILPPHHFRALEPGTPEYLTALQAWGSLLEKEHDGGRYFDVLVPREATGTHASYLHRARPDASGNPGWLFDKGSPDDAESLDALITAR